ncbi:MAG: hypothetical protein AAF943_04650 [Pseudomonadota bacterium]
MVQKALNAVCEAFEGCDTLAYADLSTKLVLATNESTELPRDALNTLCEDATVLLSEGFTCVIGTEAGFRIFLRDPVETTDGMICLCARSADIEALLPAVKDCLAGLARGDASA